jgi:hypothetical protein
VSFRAGEGLAVGSPSFQGSGCLRLEPLAAIKHSITRYRITLEVYRLPRREAARIPDGKGRWLSAGQLKQLAFASAHKRILERLETTGPGRKGPQDSSFCG